MGNDEVQGIALGLGLDTTGWSSGIAKARAELDALRRDARSLVVNAQIKGGAGGGRGAVGVPSGALVDPSVSPGFNVTRGAIRQLRIDMNQQLRQLAQQGQAVALPVKLARIPYAAMRSEISRGIGEVPITVRVASVAGQRDLIAGLLASSAASSAGKTLPRRATGGRVATGQPYLVNENTPRSEVFWPDSAGTIIPHYGDDSRWHRFRRGRARARGGYVGGIAALREAAAEYAQSRGMAAPPTGFYHPIDEDFSLRTAAAYEAMPTGPDALSRRAYRAFASETEDQYRFLQARGFHFTPSRTDPYRPTATHSKMELAGLDVARNRNMNAFASALDHPLLSKRENWIFRGVHDLFGHLAEGYSIGPRGEMNAAIKHSQMYSPLAQRAMLAETHGQNSVVNFSPTIAPGFGRSIADVNRESPGTIYAAQKAQVLPKHIVDEFNARFGISRARGGQVSSIAALMRETSDWRDPDARRRGMSDLGYDFEWGRKGGYFSDNRTSLRDVKDTKPLFPWIGPWSRQAKGGDVPEGTYIVNEIGRERFVPKDLEGRIPPEVADQIPGGGLLARQNALKQAAAEPWKPAWLRRNNAKDMTGRAGGGIVDIDGPGPKLWRAPGPGWIIPNRLMNKVPRAASGASFGGGGFESGFEAEEQRRQERLYEERYQAEQRAKAARDRLHRLTPLEYRDDSGLGELRRVRAESIPIGGRTPRTLLGAAAGFAAAGEQKRLAEEQYRQSSRGILELRKTIGPDFMGELNHQVARSKLSLVDLARTHGKDADETKRAAKVYRDSIALRHHAVDLEREQAEALGKLKTGVPDVAKSFLALQGTFAAYSIGLGAVNTAVELGTKALGPYLDQLTGWSGAALKVGQQLSDQTRTLGGNASAAIATVAGQAGVGGSGLEYLQKALGPTITAQAGAAAAAEANDLRRAAYFSTTQGNRTPGLTGGPTGGVAGTGFGWQVFGGQESFSQTIARGLSEARDPTATGKGYYTSGFRAGPVQNIPEDQATDLQKALLTYVPPNGQKQVAANERLTSSLNDVNDAAARGATYLGQQNTGLQLMTKEQLKAAGALQGADWDKIKQQFLDASKGAGDLDNATTEAAADVVLFDRKTGKAVQSSDAYRSFLTQSAQGSTIESEPAWTQRLTKELQGTIKTNAAQGAIERNVTLPAQSALDQLANPLSRAGSGFGFSAAELRKGGSGSVIQIQNLQDQVAAGTQQGLTAARNLIASNIPNTGAQYTGVGGTGSNALNLFDASVADISKYGGAIRDLNDEIANAQAGLSRKQYANSIRILSRNLQDALALAGRAHTGGREGEIERQQFLLGRQAQSLQFEMSQRQINFQTAVAGFQAPGLTGQERAARVDEAKLEASFAQKQLDIGRRQFALEGEGFKVQAGRAVSDLKAALDLETQSRDVTLLTIRNQKLISANQVLLSRAQAQAASILQEAARNQDAVLGVADARVRIFGGTIEGATNALRGVLGLSDIHTYRNAQGQIVTDTSGGGTGVKKHAVGAFGLTAPGGHVAMFGEANTEGVIAIKNPTVRELGAFTGRGMGGSTPNVNIGPFIFEGEQASRSDMSMLAREVADLVETRMGVKAKLIGIRTATA